MPKKGMRSVFFKPNTPQHQKTPPPSPMRSPLSVRMIEDNLEASHALISKWDPQYNGNGQAHQLFSVGNSEEAKQFLTAVTLLQTAMHFYIAHDPASSNLVLAQTLTQTAMNRLEREFYRLLKTLPGYYSVGDGSVSSRASLSDFEDDAGSTFADEESSLASPSRTRVPAPVVGDLRDICECMVSVGYGKECAKIYKIIRKSTVDEALYHLGVERLSLSQVQKMDWDPLEVKVKTWLSAVKVAVKTVFNSERLLCDAIFSTSAEAIREACFSDVVSEGATALFSFPESVARCKKSPEKLFRLLDLYEAVSDLWPHVESIFDFNSTAGVRSLAVASLVRVGEAARGTLGEFESAISKVSSKAAVPGGGVHPLTRYVMNYLSFLADYIGPLSDVVADWPLPSPSPLPESYFVELDDDEASSENGAVSTNASVRVAWLVLVLLCKLDGKAERYSDVALSYLFLANNLRYVVNKVTASNLRILLGGDWLARHEDKVRQYVANYERLGWGQVFEGLTNGPKYNGPMQPVNEVAGKFRRFNAAFEDAYKRQSAWIITDPKMRDEIKISLATRIVPMYREFYESYRGFVIAGAARERGMGPIGGIIRYAPDDLGNYLSDLFFSGECGTSVSSLSLSLSSAPSPSSSVSSSSGSSRGRRSS